LVVFVVVAGGGQGAVLMGEGVEAGDAGMLFLEATDGAFDGGGGFESARLDALA
jgi:hypothetical protein